MAKEDEKKKQDAVMAKIQLSLKSESARLPAAWVNNVQFATTDGGMVRLTFCEMDITAEKAIARASVTMTPSTAQLLVDLIGQFVKKVEGAVH